MRNTPIDLRRNEMHVWSNDCDLLGFSVADVNCD